MLFCRGILATLLAEESRRGPSAEGFRAGPHYASKQQRCHKAQSPADEEIVQIETESQDLSV
jgi:hypothetical protein